MAVQDDQQTPGQREIHRQDNPLVAERRGKLDAIRARADEAQTSAFPNQLTRDHRAADLQSEHGGETKAALEALDKTVSVAGRIMAKRGPFMVLQDVSGTIQLYADKKAQQTIKATTGPWDIGDIVSAAGPIHKSGKGDLYVNMECFQLLTKSLRPLPDTFYGLADQELRYRQRYLDLIVNPEVRETFKIRSRIVNFIRRYLDQRDFLEVETPMLQTIPGGATARPFVTHHNALDREMFLRIAPELYLKRLVVGGFERVYEINRNFRNEGLSSRHNPEFTMLEFYQAYATYEDLMDLTEDMLRRLAIAVLGSSTVTKTHKDAEGKIVATENYDFAQPFQRLSVFDAILQYNPDISAEALADSERARAIAERLAIPLKASWGLGKVQIEIFEKTVEHRLRNPTFITAYPTEVSPLARRNDDNDLVSDRFEFFVGGCELANGFSELNDAEDQARRFQQQAEEKEAGDGEAMYYDGDYVRALEYGLPPTAGEGIGIDRLVMLLTDSPSIRDVLLFPHMRPQW